MLATQAGLTSGGSFAPGGPTIGLIGEAGAELVIPNWLYADPKQANLTSFLETQIASKGTMSSPPVAPPPAPVA